MAEKFGAWVDTDDLNGDKDALHYTKDGYAELVGGRSFELPVDAKAPLKPPGEYTIVGKSDAGPVPVVYRRQGDDNLLVEYGSMSLDIALRLRVHLLQNAEAVDAGKD